MGGEIRSGGSSGILSLMLLENIWCEIKKSQEFMWDTVIEDKYRKKEAWS